MAPDSSGSHVRQVTAMLKGYKSHGGRDIPKEGVEEGDLEGPLLTVCKGERKRRGWCGWNRSTQGELAELDHSKPVLNCDLMQIL